MRSLMKPRIVRTQRSQLISSLLGLVGGATLWTAPALAATPAFAPPGSGQAGLAVGSDATGALRAKLCSAMPCDVSGGLELGTPKELTAQIANARLAVVGIGTGRRAIVVTVPGVHGGQSFEAVVVAPLSGNAPRIVFAGLTGMIEGPDGVRQGKLVQITDPDEDGARHIIVGDAREDLDLCGRRAPLAPELLSPNDLQLHPARLQRLSALEREQAAQLTAERVPDDTPPASSVLRTLGASSAIGNPAWLTDSKPETRWTENRGGGGRGEFAVMSAPSELPLTGFELIVHPPGALPAKAAVPHELWLVTRTQVFHVTLPSDAAQAAGARYRVKLSKPVQSDCVAAVLDSAFAERADSEVGIAELTGLTELESRDPAALVAALAGGQERARAAGALLRSLGAPGFAAIASGFAQLDEGGRRVALDAIDAAPCETSTPVYLSALVADFPEQRVHAQDRLQRCGRVSAPQLKERFPLTQGLAALRLADTLALVAPEEAVTAISARVVHSPARERIALRVMLARAAASPAASDTVRKLLADRTTPAVAELELLRALGARAPSFLPEVSAALARLGADNSFRTRYLLLAPAATLAPVDPSARQLLEAALAPNTDPRLRTRALELMPRDADAAPKLVNALNDRDPRVREAAAHAVRDTHATSAENPLTGLVKRDDWPLVRRAAADALAQLPSAPPGNSALIDALGDEIASVRAAAADALGARRVTAAARALRKRLEDKDERFEVRRASASALSALCDSDSADALSDLTKRLADPIATAEQRALGEASLQALAVIDPQGFAQRTSTLMKTPAAKAVRAAQASATSSACRR